MVPRHALQHGEQDMIVASMFLFVEWWAMKNTDHKQARSEKHRSPHSNNLQYVSYFIIADRS